MVVLLMLTTKTMKERKLTRYTVSYHGSAKTNGKNINKIQID